MSDLPSRYWRASWLPMLSALESTPTALRRCTGFSLACPVEESALFR
jgi:hypothetical protein